VGQESPPKPKGFENEAYLYVLCSDRKPKRNEADQAKSRIPKGFQFGKRFSNPIIGMNPTGGPLKESRILQQAHIQAVLAFLPN